MTLRRVAVVLAVAVAVIAGSVAATLVWGAGPQRPADGSVDVGFARDMSVHHAQAVGMAGLILDRTENDTIRTLASDIMLTQQAQIGQMHGWLDLWDQPKTTVGSRMAWMSQDGRGTEGRMPGMATPEELDRLRGADGDEAERLFLELMIDHHSAGVTMAAAAAADASSSDVRRLAEAMVTGQQAEISVMAELLEERDGTPDRAS